MTVVVKKIGGSVAVVIPKSVAREMELTEGTALELSADSAAAAIIMRKRGRRPRRPLAQIVAQIKPASYRRHNRELLSQDRPVGKELW
jgi:antitoxin component of MazEF toxin-antitoxin module